MPTERVTMRAAVARDGQVVVADVPVPAPAPGGLLVRVRLSGVNWWDVMQSRGQVPAGPSGVLGVEGLGDVVAVGAGVDPARVGEVVAWSKVPGSHAEHVAGDAGWFLPVGDALPALGEQALAGLLMQGVTAQYLATDTAPVAAGDTVVVTSAAGGVGSLLTQLLVARGARVVGVVGAEHKAGAARSAGADRVVVADGGTLVDQVRDAVPQGAAAVFDGRGGPDAAALVDLLRPRGWLVLLGTSAGPLPCLDLAALGRGSLVVTRVAGTHFAGTPGAWLRRACDVLDTARAGGLSVATTAVHPLAEAPAALDRLADRASTGKLLLRAGTP